MIAAARFYEQAAAGLGVDFLEEVERGFQMLASYPKSAPVIQAGIRGRPLKRFPFGLLYQIEGDHIVVQAVMHLRRKPDYWKDRL